MRGKLDATHLERRALVYVRQSTPMQVHEHGESRQRQYALVERAYGLGWPRPQIEVIDDDQGKSGASSDGRPGFARLAYAVGHGEAGAIFAIEVSRLARASADWQRLLALCAVAGVVVVDEQSLYDPADKDDRLLLDLKGTMSEAELHWLRLRLVGGRLNKARRGALRLTPPVGYVWHADRFEFDPDEAVCTAVRGVFARFAVEPSTWAVVRWARATGFTFPTRLGPDEVAWRSLTMGRLNALLHNPTYAGVYAYGRRHDEAVVVAGEIRHRRRRRSPDEWPVRVEAAHAGYIDWETFMHNRERLRHNQSRMHGAVPGAPKAGPALLAGLVLCGRCGRRLRVFYTGGTARTHWRYVCLGVHDTAQAICWSLNGAPVDALVETLFLETMVPAELELSLAVEQEVAAQAAALATQWQARLEHARYDARRAERRYKAVDPDHRVVARTLEREWEARLHELDALAQQFAAARRAHRVDLSAADRDALRALARDLPALWRASTTPAADRKAMLRLVIEAITLTPVEIPRRATRVTLQWRSGVVDERVIDRPGSRAPAPTVIERMRALLATGADDGAIAARLNAEALLGSRLHPWTAGRIANARRKAGLPAPTHPRRPYLPDRHPETGAYSIPGAARYFGVSRAVVKHWIATGLIRTYRQRFGRYLARWLVLDTPTTSRLAALATTRRPR
jgi:DNA invertase Pin-like site-specific DNA recombinase